MMGRRGKESGTHHAIVADLRSPTKRLPAPGRPRTPFERSSRPSVRPQRREICRLQGSPGRADVWHEACMRGGAQENETMVISTTLKDQSVAALRRRLLRIGQAVSALALLFSASPALAATI